MSAVGLKKRLENVPCLCRALLQKGPGILESLLQGGEHDWAALHGSFFPAKEPLIIGFFAENNL